MLIIRRRRGESITIGEDIEIEILETSPTQVKLGIRAPKDVSVLRKEILVTRELNRAASTAGPAESALVILAEQYREIAGAGLEQPEAAAVERVAEEPAAGAGAGAAGE